jgi:hypothetical protein
LQVRHVVGALRLAVGPVALVGFFLPWARGPGPLSGTQFSGFSLVGFAGRLQQLDLGLPPDGLLWVARLVLLGVPVAALWQLLLAPRLRGHILYRVSGIYLVLVAAACATVAIARAGLAAPPFGLALLWLAAASFLTVQAAERLRG